MEIVPIADFRCPLKTKFGIPRQSGIVGSLEGEIVLRKEFRDGAALRGLADFDYIWVIWGFSENRKRDWQPLVRPPRLGGNAGMGVFATRSPYRPNPIGMSAVKLERVVIDQDLGPVLEVSGIDMANGTPILDIKPYLSFADSYPDAVCGFADRLYGQSLKVVIPDELLKLLPADLIEPLKDLLAEDPRPRYQNDPERVYGFFFNKYEIKFKVDKEILTVAAIEPR